MEPETHYKRNILVALLSFGAMGGLGYLEYQNYTLKQEKWALGTELEKTKQEFASSSESLLVNIDALKQLLASTNADKVTAEQDIIKQKELVDSMDAQVQFISDTLGVYKKIIETDKELLEKYSKVFFMNENYTPKYLTTIPTLYVGGDNKEKTISTDIWPFLQKLLDDANASAVDLKIASAYRSFGTQTTLKSAYKVTYGTGANKFSADQGYSEHQLGTTVDFTTTKLGADNSKFENDPAYTWLNENAYKYGFILSYPKGNVYYIFEPWHWRFVGKALALRLYNENKGFYDLDQRVINEYLVSIFNQ